MGPLDDRDEGDAGAPGGHQLPDRVDHARRVPRAPRGARGRPERRLVHRRGHPSHPRDRRREPGTDAGGVEAHAALVRHAMEEGALGVASSLVYPPGSFATTEELIALAQPPRRTGACTSPTCAARATLVEAVEELIRIAKEGEHPRRDLSPQGRRQAQLGQARRGDRAKIEPARAGGLEITADMYTYTAGATGLDAAMPPWVQEGGLEAWAARLQDPKIRDVSRRTCVRRSDIGRTCIYRRRMTGRCSSDSSRTHLEQLRRQDARRSGRNAR